MAETERFDALVLGGGQGGDLLACDLARSGQRVAVVERRYVGGSCPNIAYANPDASDLKTIVNDGRTTS